MSTNPTTTLLESLVLYVLLAVFAFYAVTSAPQLAKGLKRRLIETASAKVHATL